MSDITRGRRDAQRREEQAGLAMAAIRAEAAARTGWEPWMTDEAGWGALGEGWAEQMEALDERRSRYPRDQASLAERRRRAVCDE
jgi:hypothetical protein